MQLIASYSTLTAAKQVMTKRTNNNVDYKIKYVVLPYVNGYQLWSYKQGEK